MSDEKRQDFEFEELLKYRELVTQNMVYSIQRMDILMIALSTSGIILSITTMQNVAGGDVALLKLSFSFFTLSILINLVSQFFGYSSHRKLVVIYNEKILDYKTNPETFNDNKYEEESKRAYKLGYLVETLNIISLTSLLVGVVFCLSYYWCRF